ncbi:hypothetical protein [Solobacterium moorei]|uniref:DUF7000 family protein n=1 Tax=Solobacterium moorei TaxID=102148 RepID=UPI0023F3A41F|nr:hypothetical protein [Solobacterium moorei]
MAKDTNYYLDTYQKVVNQGDLQVAYIEIMNYFTKLHNSIPAMFTVSEITPGFMDYSYFSIHDAFLYDRYLKFIIALDHRTLGIELWLVSQNEKVKHTYSILLADSEWHDKIMHNPAFGMIEVPIVERIQPDSADDQMHKILDTIQQYTSCIESFLYADEIHFPITSPKDTTEAE